MKPERRLIEEKHNPLLGSEGQGVINAITGGDLGRAQGMVLAGADVNGGRDARGFSALHCAAAQSAAGLCRLLISHAADVNAPDGQLWSVLHIAAQQGHTIILDQLLKAGARANMLGADGETPLSLTAAVGHVEVLRHLIRAGACPNVESAEGPGAEFCDQAEVRIAVPLMRAVQRNVPDVIVSELLAARARVDCMDSRQNQPLHVASHFGSVPTMRFLLEGLADPNGRNYALRTPLHYASASGAGRLVKMLAAHSAQLDALDSKNMTPLQLAKDRVMEMQLRQLGAGVGGLTPDGKALISPPLSPPMSPGNRERRPRAERSNASPMSAASLSPLAASQTAAQSLASPASGTAVVA